MSAPLEPSGSSHGSPSHLAETVAYLRERITRAPSVALVLGSGLGPVAEAFDDPVRVRYSEIPSFPHSTVPGHAGSLVSGIWEGVEVVAMQGRFHLYEGWPAATLAYPIRVFRSLGVDVLVLTNAAGGIDPALRPGELMLIADHINFMFRNPLIGAVPSGEPRYPDLSDPYDAGLRAIAVRTADELRIPLTPGIYAGVLGPSFETPAEIRMLARMGAGAVGMSTVPEAIIAASLGLRVLGFSSITNLAAGLGHGRLTHEEVLRVGNDASLRLIELLRVLIPRIVPPNLPTEAAS